jgi:hypothetical protein
MSENTIPEPVLQLIHAALPSIHHLDLMMQLLRKRPDIVEWSALATGMRADERVAEKVAADLARSGLASVSDEGARYEPGNPEIADAAALLVDAYDRFPVQLIRAIYEGPKTPAQTFADAFRLRKEP